MSRVGGGGLRVNCGHLWSSVRVVCVVHESVIMVKCVSGVSTQDGSIETGDVLPWRMNGVTSLPNQCCKTRHYMCQDKTYYYNNNNLFM